MKTNVNLEMYQNVDFISNELKQTISEIEQEIDNYCANFIKTQEDLQMISLFNAIVS